MKFIAYTICAENNARPSQYIPYGPTNMNSTGHPTSRRTCPCPNADENSAYFDDEYLVDNFDEIDAAWQDWKGQLAAGRPPARSLTAVGRARRRPGRLAGPAATAGPAGRPGGRLPRRLLPRAARR